MGKAYQMLVKVEDSHESVINALNRVLFALSNGYGITLDLSGIESEIRREMVKKNFEIRIVD